jgi:preprotein translocase subunit SecE
MPEVAGKGSAATVCGLKDHGWTMKNPLQFVQEVRQETAKVTWPTWKEVWITTTMVLIMVALTSIFFLFADVVISWMVRAVLDLGR